VTIRFTRVRIFDGQHFVDGLHDVTVRDGRVESLEPAIGATDGDYDGGVLFPGFVDAHVHLAFSDPLHVARGGVTTVLDLGAPASYATEPHPPLRFRFAGTLLTAPGGYPTRSWGAAGFGTELSTDGDAREAVATWADAGATMIKIALEPREGPMLDAAIARVVVDEAHARGLLVAAHALEAEPVQRAIDDGMDVLAHTPTGKLDDDVIAACGTRTMWVISTVRAFGGSRRAKRNLRTLHEAGCRIVYGTDLGNGAIRPGVDVDELEIIRDVLGDDEATLASACASAGEVAGSGGRIAIGEPADLVWAPAFERLRDLRGRKDVFIDGTLVR
jgi:imidazolonepropionase-like amidohydrolase